jgi:cell division protein FtsL
MVIVTSIICATVFFSILSILTYFSLFHETRKFTDLENKIKEQDKILETIQDDITQISNKIGVFHR